MRFTALACDYDGTLVSAERIDVKVLSALHRFRMSGRKLILVTGRELESLAADFSPIDLFDRVVVENGAVVYTPQTAETRLLAAPVSPELFGRLRDCGVDPLSAGRVIISTRLPHDALAARLIDELGLDLEIIYNKESVMILPAGINKAVGLRSILDEYRISPENVIGIGDAENDLDFLNLCGYSAAVANAVPQVKMAVDLILKAPDGSGILELIDRLLNSEAASAG